MPTNQREPGVWIAFLRAWVAGGVDAIGYLSLGQLFTAHMSGNTAALGAHLGRRARIGAPPCTGPCRSRPSSWGWRSGRPGSRGLPGGNLAPPAPARSGARGSCCPASAMGLQNATLRRVSGTRIRTTFVSGMLANFAEEGVTLLRTCVRGPAGDRVPSLRRTLLYGGIWLAFLAGASSGAVAQLHYSTLALLLPVAGLAALLAWNLRHPIPVDDELLAQAPDPEGGR